MLSAAQLGYITATVSKALDVTLVRTRTTSVSKDGYGHSTSPVTNTLSVAMNLIKPSATQLQAYASVIGSQRAMLIRTMQTADIAEGDTIAYDNLTWLVQNVQNAESYTVTKEFLITVVV